MPTEYRKITVLASGLRPGVNGGSSIVVVAIEPAHAEADPIRIGVPVRYRRGRWEILNDITVTQNIGIVPLNDS